MLRRKIKWGDELERNLGVLGLCGGCLVTACLSHDLSVLR